ncbi:type I DNA topoisomerase [Leucobacter sp. UT-8R-CII-1-4]|uniref:type I DNA topoisomerase n=1 Tax=Leucobacter sp. UT-8R-CII-1-4 TaxID=3040075 RepID=UPI0024A99B72|nr:type I DNA topoisomerase [Leucobacter sp. UT-8R-CII-1-4]MDI6022503.1 type I DNA topoisomerase [Leucobacter sp. UT-8R-CII-1-4]
MGAKKLVIVESPTKAKTIGGYLGDDYEVIASVGHIRDLAEPSELPAELKKGPFGKFAVDVEQDFAPYYVVNANKKKTVTELKRALKDADELWLATDEDREGEAIAWHLLEVLKPKVPVRRMVFHEITKEAIEQAKANTRDIDFALVDAQETRRILDRLYGYDISPVLWRKVAPKLSAGRVQSAATRIVVDRERERMAFVAAEYWDLSAQFNPGADASDPTQFEAKLVRLDGERLATGADFNDLGELKEKSRQAGVVLLPQTRAEALAAALTGANAEVLSVETKPHTRRPAPPFTTSTLQQEASRKLRYSSRQTMSHAQSLYENGYITYMRTDSPTLSKQAIEAARKQAAALYGAETLPDAPRVYTGKAKGAQEAHEAIRPAGDTFARPTELKGKLTQGDYALYELIWKRTVASQMADAKGSTDTVTLGVSVADAAAKTGTAAAEFTASGTVITFPGFLLAYEEGKDEKRGAKDQSVDLPQLAKGQRLAVVEPEAKGHETSPPPRFTEASLTKRLEDLGIGRPSTYAAIIGTITDRGYVTKKGQALVPSWIAFSVVRLLEEHFSELVNYDFTAEMEGDLDRIAAGEAERAAWLRDFYFGSDNHPGLRGVVDNLGEIDARAINTIRIDDEISLRNGKYGPYLEVFDDKCEVGEDGALKPRSVNIPDGLAPDELTAARAHELADAEPLEDRIVGLHPVTGKRIAAKNGRFGPYVTELPDEDEELPKGHKARTASLFKSMDPATVELDTAVALLDLPRVVGADADGTEITAQNGRYGAYLKKGTDTRTLPSEDAIFSIDLAGAEELFAQPKYGARKASSALKEFDADPVSGKPVKVKDGRFGPYVTDGETNATIPRGDSVEDITFERATELLAIKRAKGPVKRKTAAKKPAAKKPAAKKPAAKKTATGAKKAVDPKRSEAAKKAAATRAAKKAAEAAAAAE